MATLPLAILVITFVVYVWAVLVLDSKGTRENPGRTIVYAAAIALIASTALMLLFFLVQLEWK
jgi:hypothetical protein